MCIETDVRRRSAVRPVPTKADKAGNAVLDSNTSLCAEGACQRSPGSPVKCNFEELSCLF